MRHWRIWLYLIGMVAILGGCYIVERQNATAMTGSGAWSRAQAPDGASANTPAETVDQTAVATAMSAVEQTQTQTSTDTPQETEVASAATVDQCVECHTDKQRLIDTAKPEEAVVSESEGAG